MQIGSEAVRKIVILGGGSAGWITANALAHRWADRDVEITVVESPAIGTVGVGEGSTPRLKLFFDDIGVAEAEWMPRCNATYKNGISFRHWSIRPGFESYFHPFASELDTFTKRAFYFSTHARRHGVDVHAHPDRYFVSASLAARRLGPLPAESFPFVVEYGYHFDAGLLGQFLEEKAKAAGVRHVEARVIDVSLAANGDIASLYLDSADSIAADFFIDCSGFRGTLIQEALETPFLPFKENLFNDAAVVLPTPQSEEIGSQTIARALRNGWAWEIPLTHRIGNGYVYSSSFCSADDAETELRKLLDLTDSDAEARHLRMKVGQVAQHWNRNCLAVGLSQGFVEPLEATALNVVCDTVYDFLDAAASSDARDAARDDFNARALQRFECIRDYIVAHYVLTSREDTEYWRQNARNTRISDRLRAILEIWKSGANLSQELERRKIATSYTAMSWHCLLAGYGFYPALRDPNGIPAAAQQVDLQHVDHFVQRCTMNFRTQRELLSALTDSRDEA